MQEKIERIANQIELKRDKCWFQHLIERAHITEPILAARLMHLFQSIPLQIEQKRLQKFVTQCAELRNDIAHFAGQREAGDMKRLYDDMNKKNEALTHLYHAFLLHEVGVGKDIIMGWLNTSVTSFAIRNAFIAAGLLEKPEIAQDGTLTEG